MNELWEQLKQQAKDEIQLLPKSQAASVKQLKSELEAFCNMEPPKTSGEYLKRLGDLNGIRNRILNLQI